jgi:surfactin family lipopeptide synthetase C
MKMKPREVSEAKTMKTRNIEDIYPLSPMQQGMLFHTIYAPASGAYFDQITWAICGELQVPLFRRAWQEVVNRHPILRSAFLWESLDEPVQVVRQHVELPWEEADWSGQSQQRQEDLLNTLLTADRRRGFHLPSAPVMRCTLIRFGESVYQCLWSYHHILLDGWSLPLVLKEVLDLYEGYRLGKEVRLERPAPYGNYIAWLRQQDLSKAERHWRQTLDGFSSLATVGPAPTSAGAHLTENYGQRIVRVSADTTTDLQHWARSHQLTINTVMHGAWGALLSCYCGRQDVVFGTVVSGRPPEIAGVESMVGMFINTLPVRVKIDPTQRLIDWLKDLQRQQVTARQFEYSSLIDLQSWSELPAGTPLFESIVVFENTPAKAGARNRQLGFEIRQMTHREAQTGYPLTLMILPGVEMALHLTYDADRFQGDMIARMANQLADLLCRMMDNEDPSLGSVSVLRDDERTASWRRFSSGGMKPRADTRAAHGIHHRFEAQVERGPS